MGRGKERKEVGERKKRAKERTPSSSGLGLLLPGSNGRDGAAPGDGELREGGEVVHDGAHALTAVQVGHDEDVRGLEANLPARLEVEGDVLLEGGEEGEGGEEEEEESEEEEEEKRGRRRGEKADSLAERVEFAAERFGVELGDDVRLELVDEPEG